MSRKKISARETVRILNDVATQLEKGDRSLQIQEALNRAAEGLVPLKRSADLALLNQIGTQVLNINASEHRYAAVAKTMKALGPFDPEAAVSASSSAAWQRSAAAAMRSCAARSVSVRFTHRPW